MAEHRQEFQQELDAIEARVIEMFGMLAEDLTRATDALLTGNNEIVKLLNEREQVIQALYPELEALVSRSILLQAPVASDLRFLLTVLRILPELERSHSLVEHIARRADHFLSGELSPRSRGLVERMGEVATTIWRSTADAFAERSASAANQVDDLDDELDDLHVTLTAELVAGTMPLPVAIELAMVARFYERFGDHAVNLARRMSALVVGGPEPATSGAD